MNSILVDKGFNEDERNYVAHLYWSAFGSKLEKTMAPSEKALSVFAQHASPHFALAARSPDGTLIGLAGFKTQNGGLIDFGIRELQTIYGWWSGLWRGVILSVLESSLNPGVLLMDGIFADEVHRGKGAESGISGNRINFN